MRRERGQFAGSRFDFKLQLQFLVAQGGGLARTPPHIAVNQPDRKQHQADVQSRARRRRPARQVKILLPLGVGRSRLAGFLAAHRGDDGRDRVHGALAHVRADYAGGRGNAAFFQQCDAVLEFPEFLPRQHSQLVKFTAVFIAAIRLMQSIQGLPNAGHKIGIGNEIGALPREQVSALRRFGIRDQAREVIQGLFAQLRAVRAFIGHIQAGLTRRGEKEQPN